MGCYPGNFWLKSAPVVDTLTVDADDIEFRGTLLRYMIANVGIRLSNDWNGIPNHITDTQINQKYCIENVKSSCGLLYAQRSFAKSIMCNAILLSMELLNRADIIPSPYLYYKHEWCQPYYEMQMKLFNLVCCICCVHRVENQAQHDIDERRIFTFFFLSLWFLPLLWVCLNGFFNSKWTSRRLQLNVAHVWLA